MKRVIAVTGAHGFLGNALCMQMVEEGLNVRPLVRSSLPGDQYHMSIGSIGPLTDWSKALDGVDSIVHCAARAHIMNEQIRDSQRAYHLVNAQGTINLARQAADAGLRRFIFISSVKVNGESTLDGRPFRPDDEVGPSDPYGMSKYEAELALQHLGKTSSMEVVIIRPPLVYGPKVRANFAALMEAVSRGLPLPFGSVNNQRSFISLDNLMNFIILCIDHPLAASEIFLVSDGHDLSTPELVRLMAQVAGVKSRLFSIHPLLLRACATLFKRQALMQRLCSNLQLDISKSHERLGWMPPITVEEGLRRAFLTVDYGRHVSKNEKIF